MTQFAQGLKSLFGGNSGNADAEQTIAGQQREQQTLQLDRQQQDLQQQQQLTDASQNALMRVPRGRRLLLAATGDAGLPSKLGG